uniref:Zgc:195245 n=1 Tax=Neogobius melanostomus TaxID=47308 RepID=A0A8C6TI87_9GOBI
MQFLQTRAASTFLTNNDHHLHLVDASQPALNRQSTVDNNEISQPNKLNGSVADFQNLHRELLLGHKRGLLFGVKPELKRVMEQRRGKLHKEEELARLGPSDLETELRKRQQKLKEYELEEMKQRENQERIPEFIRVKDNLRRTHTSDQ